MVLFRPAKLPLRVAATGGWVANFFKDVYEVASRFFPLRYSFVNHAGFEPANPL